MNIAIKKTAEETIIELAGRLDTTSAPDLDKIINKGVPFHFSDGALIYCKMLKYASGIFV